MKRTVMFAVGLAMNQAALFFVLWLIDAQLVTWVSAGTIAALLWAIYGIWIGIELGWRDCMDELGRRGVPAHVECSWCGGIISPGVDPRSHGICIPCSEIHFDERLGEFEREGAL